MGGMYHMQAPKILSKSSKGRQYSNIYCGTTNVSFSLCHVIHPVNISR